MTDVGDGDPRRVVAPFRVVRRSDQRVVSGLAAGIAERLGIDAAYVRAGFLVLSLVWGLGILLYGAGWAATADAVSSGRSDDAVLERHQLAGLGAVFLGILLMLRGVGIWPGDGVVWPPAAIAFGLAFLWEQREIDSRETLLRMFEPGNRSTRVRTVTGVVLLLVGLSILTTSAVPQLGGAVVAVLVTGLGLVMVFGPWVWSLLSDLGEERRRRIRQEERAEMAAHLHDSVLQTLALIQRTDDSRRMVTLARAQERELRTWLYERTDEEGDEVLSTALRAAASRVEADFDIPVEVVTVGERALDARLSAVASATGEALTNAAKHSGAARISLYSEATPDGVEIWVSDQGKGFDPGQIPEDRQGIARSIVGRVERHGGSVEISSLPGEGTEVHIIMRGEADT